MTFDEYEKLLNKKLIESIPESEHTEIGDVQKLEYFELESTDTHTASELRKMCEDAFDMGYDVGFADGYSSGSA